MIGIEGVGGWTGGRWIADEYIGLLRFRARPITPCGEALPLKQASNNPGVQMSMNETVYLFALSVPDLLEALVANQDRSIIDTRPDEPEAVHRRARSGEDTWQSM